jgi:hypothetical protein
MRASVAVAAMMAAGVAMGSGAEAAVFGPGENIVFEVETPQWPDLYGSSPAAGAFTDTYNIVFTENGPGTGSFRATLTEVIGITDIAIALIEPFNLGGDPVIDRDPDPLSFLLLGGFLGGSFAFSNTVYKLQISGTAAAGASYMGTGLPLLTPVPAAFPMLAVALAGLAAAGARRAAQGTKRTIASR